MIYVTKDISLSPQDIQEEFVRASGPGGQNVNKVASAVQLRFDVRRSRSLPADVKQRLITLAGKRVNSEGILVIDARRFRHQERNRLDALERLKELIRKAVQRPKKRLKTKPSKSAVLQRLKSKKKHSHKKQLRKKVGHFE